MSDGCVSVSDIKELATEEAREGVAKSLNWYLKRALYKSNYYGDSGEIELRNAIFMIRVLVFFDILDSDAGDKILVELHECDDRKRSIFI